MNTEISTDVEVIHTNALVRPGGSIAEIVGNMDEYQKLCQALLDSSDYQEISGKRFPKRSAWRKLAVAYGVSFEIRDRSLFWDDDGNLKSAEFIVRATAPNGRFADGWGACAVAERNAGRKASHDIPATAETRAKNRAAADLFGMGEVSSEEVDRTSMYISESDQKALRTRTEELNDAQTVLVKQQWKEQKLPALEYLNEDQAEVINTLIDRCTADIVFEETSEDEAF